MEIKLKQSEIEDAVRSYLNGLFALATGATFSIDFQATRGPEGFIANIVIGNRESVAKAEKAEVVDEPVPAQTTEAKPQAQATQPKTKRLVLDQKAKEEPAAVVETPVEEIKDPEPEAPVENEANKPPFTEGESESQAPGFKGFEKEDGETPVETTEPVEQPVRKSLFGGLGKPSNS